jgi:hypothetical protein
MSSCNDSINLSNLPLPCLILIARECNNVIDKMRLHSFGRACRCAVNDSYSWSDIDVIEHSAPISPSSEPWPIITFRSSQSSTSFPTSTSTASLGTLNTQLRPMRRDNLFSVRLYEPPGTGALTFMHRVCDKHEWGATGNNVRTLNDQFAYLIARLRHVRRLIIVGDSILLALVIERFQLWRVRDVSVLCTLVKYNFFC